MAEVKRSVQTATKAIGEAAQGIALVTGLTRAEAVEAFIYALTLFAANQAAYGDEEKALKAVANSIAELAPEIAALTKLGRDTSPSASTN